MITKKLAILNNNKKDKTVYICFADFENNKIISQEEAIFEEEEFYKIMKRWLVKFENKPTTESDRHQVLLNNCVDNDEVILHKREIEEVKG